MDPFATSHFSDDALLHNLKLLVAHDCRTTAVMLTRIAEVEERKLFLQVGHPSMHSYCVRELHFSEGVAYKRIEAARAARRFPGTLVALAEGRVHLRAVSMLAPHLTSANADNLLEAATHKTRFELQQMLAERFPKPDLPERLQAIPPPSAPTPVAASVPGTAPIGSGSNSLTIPEQADRAQVAAACCPAQSFEPRAFGAPAPRERVTPLSPKRFGLQCTLDQETCDLLQRAQALMGHQNPAGEIAPVIKRALELLVAHLEKRKLAVTDRPGPSKPSTSPRHIPAGVKSAVWKRDGGRCTFVSDGGQRCPARSSLEFDHIEPVARGGQATAANVRLACRAHNQHAAERTFGADFMERKRAKAIACQRGNATRRVKRSPAASSLTP